MMDKAKYKIPIQCRIGDTCFTSLATIGGNLFTIHPKNINNVHKDSNDVLSVIIILGTNVHVGETVFNDREKMNDIGKIAHILNHSHVRCVVGALIKIHTKDLFGLVIELFYPLSSTNQYFFTLYIMVQDFMTNIWHQMIERNIWRMVGVVFFRNKSLERNTMQNIKRLIQIDIMF